MTITDIHTLVEAIIHANRSFDGQVWWRGHRCSAWPLLPSVYRGDRGYRYEQNAILRFQQRTPSRYQPAPSKNDFFSWLFLMQHYRLPTRLLDWTESPLTACHFALDPCTTDTLTHTGGGAPSGELIALNPYLLNSNQISKQALLLPEDPSANAAIRAAFRQDAEDVDYVVAVMPSEVDIRMMVQLSMFTAHASGIALDDLPNKDEFLMRFQVFEESKRLLTIQLKQLGIRESNLFPDLEHLAKETAELEFKPPPSHAEESIEESPTDDENGNYPSIAST